MKKIIFILILIFNSFVFINNSNAQEVLSLPQMPGHIEGEGIHFEITNSEYLNIKLDSLELIKLTLESIPEMVTMNIEASTSTIATSTQIILSGFNSLTTYYKYEDDYHNLVEFTTDENGNYSYVQDLLQQHLIFIQPRKSTKFIKDNATGGDCTLIGNWNISTKTCTLTKDLNETIQIDSNNITLDGNGHTLTGSGTGSGVFINNSSKVILKNLNITNFSRGIYTPSLTPEISNNTFINNNLFNNGSGMRVYSNNILINNKSHENKGDGIVLGGYGGNNILINNSIYNNRWNFYIDSGSYQGFKNNIDTSNTVDGKPIYYIIDVSNKIFDSSTNAGVFFCIRCENVTIKDLTLSNSIQGLTLWESKNIKVENVTTFNNRIGIASREQFNSFSSNNFFFNNTFIDNNVGLVISTLDNLIINNNFIRSVSEGIVIGGVGNKIYNNNFIDNNHGNARIYSEGPIFDFDLPIGGNYWSNFDTLAEGCNDLNSDNICDSPYIFTGGQDNLPWKIKDGWLLSQQSQQMINPTIGGKIKCDFYCYLNHGGIDIDKTLYQTPVKAVAAGTIVKIDNIDNSAAGKWIWIYHGDIKKLDGSAVDKISTRYLHLDTIDSSLRVGQQINQGTIIGTVGLTGATAPHLHFETRQGDIPSDLDYRKTTALDPLSFVDYPLPGVSVSAFSPVDIIITDPDGLIISKTTNNFGDGADYFDPRYIGYFEDGEPIKEYDLITIDSRKDGDYLINIVPESGALLEDTYTLKSSSCGNSVVLGENIAIKDIPTQPYIIRLNGCAIEKIIPVNVRIEPKTINLGSNGLISAFIEFFKGFEDIIGNIDFSSIYLETALAERVNNVNNYKLLAKFKTQGLSGFSENDNYPLKIFGKLLDGTAFEGVDTSRLIKN